MVERGELIPHHRCGSIGAGAIREIRYTAGVLERLVKRNPDRKKVYHVRRHDLVERLLGMI